MPEGNANGRCCQKHKWVGAIPFIPAHTSSATGCFLPDLTGEQVALREEPTEPHCERCYPTLAHYPVLTVNCKLPATGWWFLAQTGTTIGAIFV